MQKSDNLNGMLPCHLIPQKSYHQELQNIVQEKGSCNAGYLSQKCYKQLECESVLEPRLLASFSDCYMTPGMATWK
jgi:hypothetical protein